MAEPLQKAEPKKKKKREPEANETGLGYTVTPEGRVVVDMGVLLKQLRTEEVQEQLESSETWLKEVLGGEVEFSS